MSGDALLPATRDRVEALLGVRVRAVEAVASGPDHAVLAVRLEGHRGRAVAKAYGPAVEAGHLRRTAAVMALARGAGAPVPAVLAVDDSSGPWRFLVQEHVEGVAWRGVRPRLREPGVRAAHRALATALLAVRSVTFDAFGEVPPDPPHAVPGDLLAALHGRVARRVADAARRDLAHAVLDRHADLFAGQAGPGGADAADRPVLCHDDLHDANVLFAPGPGGWRLAGVVDWDKAWAGPADQDAARMAFWDGMTGPGFWEVYRAAGRPDPRSAGRELVHQLLWCLEYDVPTPRHRADTAALCRRLGVPPP